MGIVFVGGVYAVGKTTACEHAASAADVAHATASRLIKSERAEAIPDRGKSVRDVVENQRLLIRAVERLRGVETRDIVLDGHFTIPNTEGEIDLIAPDVFRAIGVSAAVVYRDDPAAIVVRLSARDAEHPTKEAVSTLQDAEIQHARHVASVLTIPLLILEAFDSASLINAIREWQTA